MADLEEEYESVIDGLRRSIQVLLEDDKHAEEQHRKHDRKIRRLKSRMASEAATLKELSSENDAIGKENSQLRKSTSDLNKEIKMLKKKCVQLEAENSQKENTIQVLESEIESVKNEWGNEVEKMIIDFNEERNDYESRIRQLDDDFAQSKLCYDRIIQNLNVDLDWASKELKTKTLQHSTIVAKNEGKISSLESEKNELEKQLSQFKKENELLIKENNDLMCKVNFLSSERKNQSACHKPQNNAVWRNKNNHIADLLRKRENLKVFFDSSPKDDKEFSDLRHVYNTVFKGHGQIACSAQIKRTESTASKSTCETDPAHTSGDADSLESDISPGSSTFEQIPNDHPRNGAEVKITNLGFARALKDINLAMSPGKEILDGASRDLKGEATPSNEGEFKPLCYDGRYEGERNLQGQRHGSGHLVCDNGTEYNGFWQIDKAHGQGQATYSNGDTYSGGWKHGKRNGHGILTFSCGDVFEGQWENDEKHGVGAYHWKDGKTDVILYRHNHRTGEGVRWNADCTHAFRLLEDSLFEEISLNEAQTIVKRLGLINSK